jgi:hypothetical protein
MSILGERFVVSTSAIVTVRAAAVHTRLLVRAAGGTIYLGDSTVSSTAGLTLTTTLEPVPIDMWPGDRLYALASSSACVLEALIRY